MSGKPTFRNGRHPSRDAGGWITPVSFSTADIETLNDILGRKLTNEEINRIATMLGSLQIHAPAEKTVNHQDIIKTLKGMSNADDTEIQRMFAHCDDTTEALLEEAIHVDMGVPLPDAYPAAYASGLIRGAALNALRNLPRGKDGARVLWHRMLFAQAVRALWADLGRQDDAVWENNGNTTPFVQFAWRLLDIVEPDTCPDPSNVAKLLRKVIA